MSRRNGRVIAFQALYSWDVTKSSLDDLLSFSWLQKDSEIEAETQQPVVDLSETAKEERTFASLIIAGTISHIDEIDKLIENHLSASWSMDRIADNSLDCCSDLYRELKETAASVSGTSPISSSTW